MVIGLKFFLIDTELFRNISALRPYIFLNAESRLLGINTMKMKALFLCLLAAATAFAAESFFRVTLFQASTVNGTELRPGEYKLELVGNKAVISKGKHTVEAEVKVETAGSKFRSNSIRYQSVDGKMKVREVRLGGTNIRLVFN